MATWLEDVGRDGELLAGGLNWVGLSRTSMRFDIRFPGSEDVCFPLAHDQFQYCK